MKAGRKHGSGAPPIPDGDSKTVVRSHRCTLGLAALDMTSAQVAQVSYLLYRGFPIRRALVRRVACRLEAGDTADWKSALH
jgi:hypothetical protein